jgi:RNA polymerase sigma factor (sigma-70 family)
LNQKTTYLNNTNYIKGLLNNDRKALELIYSNYSERVKNHIIKNGGTVDDAKDVFQEALIVIYNKAQTPNFELTSQFYTYFFGICRFIWDRKYKRKSNNHVTIPDDNRYIDNDDIEESILAQERYKIYESNLQKLGEFCQQLLISFFTGETMEIIAEKFDLKNAHTARNRKYRCQKELEKLIKEDAIYKELAEK